MPFPNKFAGTCAGCGIYVPVGRGVCAKENGRWIVRCDVSCTAGPVLQAALPVTAQQPKANVGDLSGVLALFAKAKSHLKRPAIVIAVPQLGDNNEWKRDDHGRLVWSGRSIRINVATARAKMPGTLTILDADRDELNGDRDWFGRILLDGTFQKSKAGYSLPGLAKRLAEFAAAPARVAGEDGRLHGRCCFCRNALSDERSTAVGYGKTCADHYGLEWGQRPDEFAAEAA